MIIAALALRCALFSFKSPDMNTFLIPWLNHIVSAGRWQVLGTHFSDYTPPYIYLLDAASFLNGNLPQIVLIKAISIPFEIFSAVLAYKIVEHFQRTEAITREVSINGCLAFLAILFMPTLVINGSAWGQCDSIFASFLLAAMYGILKGNPWLCTLSFAIALCFKLQAIAFLPVLALLLLHRRIRIRHLAVVPIVWTIVALPSRLAGRPFLDIVSVYLQQTKEYPSLAINVANFWIFFDPNLSDHHPMLFRAVLLTGIGFAALTVLAVVWLVWRQRSLSDQKLLLFTTFSLVIVPFMLPKMHDRYFFAGELFAIVLASVQFRYLIVALLLQCSGLIVYANYLLSPVAHESFRLRFAVLLTSSALVYLSRELFLPKIRLTDKNSGCEITTVLTKGEPAVFSAAYR